MNYDQTSILLTSHLQHQEREVRLGRILNNLVNEIYIFGVNDLHFLEVNEIARRNLGYSIEEIVKLTPLDLKPEYTKEKFEAMTQPLTSGEKELINFETVQKRKDASVYPVNVRLQLYSGQGEPVYVAIVLDITDQKHAEQALRQSEERFDLAMRGANDGLWDWDLTSNEVFFSPRWKSMLGYEQHELKNHFDTWANNVHPADLQQALETVQKYVVGEAEEYRAQFRMRHKQGRYVGILSRGLGVRDESGKLTRIVGTHVDITERQNTENKLRESENKFRNIFNSSNDAIMLLKQGKFFDCNNATLAVFGCATREEFVTKKPSDLSPPFQPNGQDSLTLAEQKIAEALKNGSNNFEWLHRRINGDVFPAEVLLTTMPLDGEIVIEASVRDITERKKSEQILHERYTQLKQANKELKDTQAQLLQADKMASIGQLAAGVAHEINNPVGYVSSNITSLKTYLTELFELVSVYENTEGYLPDGQCKIELLKLKQKLDLDYLRQDIDDLIDESLEGVTRVKQIVQDLKDFSHVDEAELQYSDLHKGLNSTLNIVHNELKYKAEIIKQYGDIPEIECMPSQLNQVFMNLLVNAGHAIEGQGEIHIRTGLQEDRWVWVDIEDTGQGISEDSLPHIFEPFYTTKQVGKGTGLGLSLAYGIIEKHKGKIEVRSELGKGTCFRILLPLN